MMVQTSAERLDRNSALLSGYWSSFNTFIFLNKAVSFSWPRPLIFKSPLALVPCNFSNAFSRALLILMYLSISEGFTAVL